MMYRTHVVVAGLLIVGSAQSASARQTTGAEEQPHVTAAATVTNKGISLIPSFTLGRPAAIFDLGIRKGNLSFEPQFRVGLDGKPWSFIFWWRHRPIVGQKFRLTVGAHPAVLFRTRTLTTNELPTQAITVTRYLAADVAPNYFLRRNLSVGPYYLYSYAIEDDVVKHTHFVAARVTLSDVAVSDRYSIQLAPQLYYLRSDSQDGVYFNVGTTLTRQNFPLSLSAMVNKPIQTQIAAARGLLWNVSVGYTIR